jgi:uncharacterized 2Fe-2S/4Fe-4S cluster protein (DUF4445 family)
MNITLELPEETTLLEAIRAGGYALDDTSCNGRGICGKCKVRVLGGACSAATESEKALLGPDFPSFRLACQCKAKGTVTLDLPMPAKPDRICSDFPGTVTADANRTGLGIALDIGTTTLALFLADRSTGTILGKQAALNKQRAFGADVISRIDHCNEHADGLQVLHDTITSQVASLVSKMIASIGRSDDELTAISVAANTTMLHLFVGENPEGLAHAPFTARFLDERQYRATDLGLPFERCTVSLVGGIGAYVGSDITAGIHSSDLEEKGKVNLLLDLGTNGEIALWDKDRLLTCSCAAGPVFEGSCISCGTGSIDGAICRVREDRPDGPIRYETIGNKDPIGICGSGIIDLASLLVRRSIVDRTGAMQQDFALEGTGLVLTRRDIREIQLAKAAISGGIHTLLRECGRKAEEVDRVFLAGGLGTFLDGDSATTIGILEPCWRQKAVPVGNASLKGAFQHLVSKDARIQMQAIRKNARYIELSGSPLFGQLYIEAMVFGQ